MPRFTDGEDPSESKFRQNSDAFNTFNMKLSFGKPVNKGVGELLAVLASATKKASLS